MTVVFFSASRCKNVHELTGQNLLIVRLRRCAISKYNRFDAKKISIIRDRNFGHAYLLSK